MAHQSTETFVINRFIPTPTPHSSSNSSSVFREVREPSDGAAVNRDLSLTGSSQRQICHVEDEDEFEFEDDFLAQEIIVIAFLIRVIS
jgi:hypothetical protein